MIKKAGGTEVSDTVENLFYGESGEYRMWGILVENRDSWERTEDCKKQGEGTQLL